MKMWIRAILVGQGARRIRFGLLLRLEGEANWQAIKYNW
jgi:hypothetical protein